MWENTVQKKGKNYDVTNALDITRLMLAVGLHRSPRKILPLAKMLFLWASKSRFLNVKYTYRLEEEKVKDFIEDTSLVPCVLRALVSMARKLEETGGTGKLQKYIGTDPDVVINKVYIKAMQNLITEGKYADLWGVENGGLTYELYYTERTIEALTEFLRKYRRDPRVATGMMSGKAPDPSRITNVTITGGVHMDKYEVGQAGAVGPQAHAHDMEFKQIWNQVKDSIDLPKLTAEIGSLREQMKKEAVTLEHDAAVGEISKAEQAARSGNGAKAVEYLKAAGQWAADIAVDMGAKVIVELLERAK